MERRRFRSLKAAETYQTEIGGSIVPVLWEARVRRRGSPERSRCFERRIDAENWAAVEDRQIRLGAAADTSVTFHQLLEQYWQSDMWLDREDSREKDRVRYDYWRAKLGPLKVAEITVPLVAQHKSALRKAGLSNGTINRYLSALSSVYTGVGEHFPNLVCPVGKTQVRRLREADVDPRYLDDVEFWRMSETAEAASHEFLWPMVLGLLSSGARCSELLSLQWRSVDLVAGTALLSGFRREGGRTSKRKRTAKIGERRTLRFRGPALLALRGLSERPHEQWVWSRTETRPTWPRAAWDRMMAQAGVEHFTPHDCRHTSGTWLAQQGAGGPEIKMHLGHKSMSMTDRYVHLAAGAKSEIGPKLVPRYC
jgi:integrase